MERRGWGAEVYAYVKFFHAKKDVHFERLRFAALFHSSCFPHCSRAKCLPLPVQINVGEVQGFMNPLFFPKDKPPA